MPACSPSSDVKRSLPPALNTVRAAGSATVMAGVLTLCYAVAFAALTPMPLNVLEFALSLIVGLGLIATGVGTLRIHHRSLWVTLVLTAVVLAIQLWAAYGGGRSPSQASLSVYLLTVPLVVLITNTLAIGAVRTLKPKNA